MDYLKAQRRCNIVMRGGVTSGIVYPSAVCKLAEVYRFENIGGTSAGAIAAAATAAAEYARRRGDGNGFRELSVLPQFLASRPTGKKETTLSWLFQPDPSLRPLHTLALAFLGEDKLAKLIAVLQFSPLTWLIALLASLLTFLSCNYAVVGVCLGMFAFSAVFALLLGRSIWNAVVRLPANGFGLCSGRTTAGSAGPQGLTDWLADYLDKLAGISETQPKKPLTFGDLRSSGIRLRMMTTCLTHGRPYGLPLDSNRFYFKAAEFLEYFPEYVVQWMMENPGEVKDDPKEADTTGFSRLPNARNLPIVVAARMSLSFPILFRAVPLYTVDYTIRKATKEEPRPKEQPGSALPHDSLRKPERCWFVDGGICSNFPLHLFDDLLPRWPTFGVNLQPTRKDRPESQVWLPERNEEGFGELWSRLEHRNGAGALGSYLLAILDTARNWMDNRQIGVPGYRDRVVQVRLDEGNEGGLNLNMPSPLVDEISMRGEKAAALLISHFHNPAPEVKLTWQNHRWVRLRSTLALLEGALLKMEESFDVAEAGELSYRELLARTGEDPPDSYRLGGRQRHSLTDWLGKLIALAGELRQIPPDRRFSQGEPRPRPALRISPAYTLNEDADQSQSAATSDPIEDAGVAARYPDQATDTSN